MKMLTRIKNKEIEQRQDLGETNTSPHDCYQLDEHFNTALDGVWRTKVDDTSLWVRLRPAPSSPHPPHASCIPVPHDVPV
jgi:hypothetical protein